MILADLAVAIPIAIICVLGSAFCSGTEVALFSLRRVDREQLARSDRFVDHKIVALLERPRRLIATVLIGNEAFNSILAVTTLAVVLRLCAGQSLWAIGGIALAAALPPIVLIAEVTSKTLAAKAPLLWSRVCVLPLAAFALLVTPVRALVQLVTGVLLAPFGDAVRNRPARDLSEEEFRSMVDAGSAQGQVDARERRLIHRVFEFSDKNVGQVMTPRERMFALSYDLPVQRLIKELASRGFSRVPIYQKSLDNIRGVLNAKDLVKVTGGQPLRRPLGELLHEPLFVPRTTPVKRLFLQFKQKKKHMAIVVSEYGKVLGLVTMDDLLGQIFGAMRDERAALQNSVPTRTHARTPAGEGRGEGDLVHDGLERSQPIERVDGDDVAQDYSVPVDRVEGDDLRENGPAPHEDTSAAEDIDDRGEDVPARAARRIGPVHPVDEVTPPATDVRDLPGMTEEKSS